VRDLELEALAKPDADAVDQHIEKEKKFFLETYYLPIKFIVQYLIPLRWGIEEYSSSRNKTTTLKFLLVLITCHHRTVFI